MQHFIFKSRLIGLVCLAFLLQTLRTHTQVLSALDEESVSVWLNGKLKDWCQADET